MDVGSLELRRDLAALSALPQIGPAPHPDRADVYRHATTSDHGCSCVGNERGPGFAPGLRQPNSGSALLVHRTVAIYSVRLHARGRKTFPFWCFRGEPGGLIATAELVSFD
jgi:hypothetical protein